MQYEKLVIRKDKEKNIVLFQNREKVFFLYQNNQMVFNSLNYDEVSDKFQDIVNKNAKN